jgi:ATP-binding cassette subfamily B protein
LINVPAGRQTPDPRPFTLEAMATPPGGGSVWGRIPALTRSALGLVWRAAPRQLVATVVLQVLAALTIGLQLLVGRELVHQLITARERGGDLAGVLPHFGVLMGAMLFSGIVLALIAHYQRLLSELVARYTLAQIMEVSTSVGLQSFEDPVFHDQLERAKASGLQRPIEIVSNLTTMGTALVTSLGVAGVLLALQPILLLLTALAAVPVLLSSLANSRQAYTFEWVLTPQSRERYYLLQLLTEREPAKELRAFDATPFLRSRYDALTEERLRELRKYLRRRLRVSLSGATGTAVGSAIALGSLVVMLATGRIDVATAAAAGVAIQVLATRLSAVTSGLGRLVESGMFLDDFHSFLALGRQARLEPATPPRREPTPQSRFAGLAVDGVSFTYPGTDRRVLDDVSLEVAPGEVVALVGENGSGKTTLVKLICSLYNPDAGRVLWNGVDADLLDGRAVRDAVTVLFQDFVQYHLTVDENILLGRVDGERDPHAIEDAARRAGAHELVRGLPGGYATRLGRQFYGGHELSIGQWQRLALARAFYRGGDFLILDEPTASLDPRAEHDLFAQMRQLAEGRSVLLISHRFSSVRSADRIYVVHSGRIVESGTHEALTEQGGRYAELFEMQAQAYLARAHNG